MADLGDTRVRLGEERARRTSYRWRSLIDAGAVVTNGTDTPVEDIDPILSFYGAVSRKTREGKVFVPEHRVSRDEALRAYTLNNAFAACIWALYILLNT